MIFLSLTKIAEQHMFVEMNYSLCNESLSKMGLFNVLKALDTTLKSSKCYDSHVQHFTIGNLADS